jgi:Endosomal/lysosomal potassium channel TMEM175
MSPGKTETVISKCAEDIGSEKSEISNRSESSELMKSSTASEMPYKLHHLLG